MRPRLLPALLVAALTLGTLASVSATPPDETVVVTGTGNDLDSHWIRHSFEVDRLEDVQVVLDWTDPTADVNVFLREPGASRARVYDNSDARPKVLETRAEVLGEWTVWLKVKVGSTDYELTINEWYVPEPGPVQPAETPDSTWQTNGRVRDAIVVGDQLWLTGHFDAIRPPGTAVGDPASVSAPGLAVLDATTGAPADIAPPALDGNGWTLAASPDGAVVYVGGTFKTVDGGVDRRHLAAVSTATGELLDLDVRPNSLVRSLLVLDDGTLVAGGQFRHIGGEQQRYLAAIDPVAGTLVAGFAPLVEQVTGQTCPPRCEPYIDALAVGNGGELYIGGHFGVVNGERRTNAAAISLADPLTTLAFDPNVFTPSTQAQPSVVTTIAVAPAGSPFADRVVVCGDFKRIGGQLSTNVGAVDAVTGARISGWEAQTNGGTPACAMTATTVVVGGHFTKIGPGPEAESGVARAHMATLDPQDGAVLSWDPGANSNLGLHMLRVFDGRVLVGGDFTRTGDVDQQGFGSYAFG